MLHLQVALMQKMVENTRILVQIIRAKGQIIHLRQKNSKTEECWFYNSTISLVL